MLLVPNEKALGEVEGKGSKDVGCRRRKEFKVRLRYGEEHNSLGSSK